MASSKAARADRPSVSVSLLAWITASNRQKSSPRWRQWAGTWCRARSCSSGSARRTQVSGGSMPSFPREAGGPSSSMTLSWLRTLTSVARSACMRTWWRGRCLPQAAAPRSTPPGPRSLWSSPSSAARTSSSAHGRSRGPPPLNTGMPPPLTADTAEPRRAGAPPRGLRGAPAARRGRRWPTGRCRSGSSRLCSRPAAGAAAGPGAAAAVDRGREAARRPLALSPAT
mmetsp:Transcript_39841/g.94655  ORF Transcript_39841/g.94655 Transcript_39841/m.94655 type:complete len:227 (+) Transcript_39841:2111-2791(+)